MGNSRDAKTEENLRMWLEGDVDIAVKNEIRRMLKTRPEEITERFYTRLSFGTGGMRGLMGIGTNRMNRYTVGMATQGLANYLKKQPKKKSKHSVLIGYDSRHSSREFAEESARVLAANELDVYIFDDLRPTPLVSFGCRQKGASAAIMVTASHNPPEYNGFKVYWCDGGQVVPPHDQGIIQEVENITDLSQVKRTESTAHRLIEWISDEMDNTYLQAMRQYQSYREQTLRENTKVRVVYTSLHGTGITLAPLLMRDWGFTQIAFVNQQCIPDGEFPTVKNPNPEESSALALGMKTLQEKNADILIATDPDADRVGLAVMCKGKPLILNGNQIACLCLYHICQALSSHGRFPKKAAFIKTIATTELFKVIAESFGGTCFNVLTGFKYVAEKIRQWEGQENGYQYLFGGEESYGYLLGTQTRDKDAILISALLCELVLDAKLKGITLIDLLHQIYEQFGVYWENLSSITFPQTQRGKEMMEQTMQQLQITPPQTICGRHVVSVENYLLSQRINLATGEKSPLKLPASNAFLFWLDDETKILIRPSGTEAKVKIYCGVVNRNFLNTHQALKESQKKTIKILEEMKKILKYN